MSPKGLILLLASLPLSNAGRGKPSLDNPFQSALKKLPQKPCVSLFTRDGRIGCGTYSRDEMTGAMLEWSTLVNSDYYSDGTVASSLPEFIAVVDEYEYNAATVEQIIASSDSSLLKGILVLNHTSSSSASLSYNSPASQYPRGDAYLWNPNGDDLLSKDMYGLPTAYVENADIAEYILTASKEQSTNFLNGFGDVKKNVFDEDYHEFPPVMATFNLYMGPEGMDSKTCLSWVDTDGDWSPKCLPLGGTSVWGLAGSPYERGSYNQNDDDGKQPVVVVATNMDATAMFHDAARGANTAAANILTVVMAAKIFGESVSDKVLDTLENKVMFAFFQGENYGYMGSRSFFRDVVYPGFQCDSSTVAAKAKDKDADYTKMACLSPLRHELDFLDLGNIHSMIAVDQVGILSTENTLYVHDSSGGDGTYSGIPTSMSTDDFSISAASAGSLPPSPLTSLYDLSGGNIGGIVIAGYDDAFAENSFYLSHLDSPEMVDIDLAAVAKAASVVARTALATAYGDNYYDGVAADTIAELDSDDETLNELADCLLNDGTCSFLSNYANMERSNNKADSGIDLGVGQSLGKPPNYYPSVYTRGNGQPFVQLDSAVYGSYTGEKEYGENSDDIFLIRPNWLAMSLHGLLNDYLGRGGSDEDGNAPEFSACKSTSDCSSTTYCPSAGDRGVCSGSKVCVCSRSHYHIALDEAIIPSPNNGTSIFKVADDDEGTSPMYTEPYWSNEIGVQVFRAANGAANWTVIIGAIASVGCIVSTMFLKKRLRKEKLY